MELIYCPKNQEAFYEKKKVALSSLSSDSDKALWHFYNGRFLQKLYTEEQQTAFMRATIDAKMLSIKEIFDDWTIIAEEFRLALHHINKAIDKNPQSGELLSIKAETLSQLAILGNFSHIVTTGISLNSTTRRALKLDPANIRAKTILAYTYTFSPPSLGGNIAEGYNLLSDLHKKKQHLNKDQLYNTYTSLAFNCYLSQKPDEAQIWITEAEKLYPQSTMIQTLKNWK